MNETERHAGITMELHCGENHEWNHDAVGDMNEEEYLFVHWAKWKS
jgi:hypothetical protein